MNRPNRFGTAASMLALAAALAGCAGGNTKRESIFGSKVDRSNIGLATRAQAALASGDTATAVELAERAVENTPTDAGFRALLANCYFAAGRFASAEAAYRDSLSLHPVQPQALLKLALVQIAQGKNGEALSVLDTARDALDPADYGLAVALAGRPDDAVAILNHAARMSGADSRARQNLALAYGLSGDWMTARTIAAQDIPPEQLDQRIQQWMGMASPSRPSDQVAALTGVTPVAADPGQPVRLALNRAPAEPAHAQAPVQPQAPVAQPMPVQSFAEAPAPAPVPAAAEAPLSAPPVAEIVAPPAPPEPMAAPAPAVVAAVQSLIEPTTRPDVDVQAVELVAAVAPKPVDPLPTKFDAPVQTAGYVAITDTIRHAAERSRKTKGNSRSVVQLGAYGSPQRVSAAWAQISKRYPALRDYTPMRARFEGPRGTVWRLSIKGFASQQEAIDRCERLQSRGASCFVRSVAGDSPVQFASR